MELHAPQAQVGDLGHLIDRAALVRVDRAQPGEHVREVAAGRGHGLVRYPGPTGGGLGVPGQQDRAQVQAAVVVGQFGQGLAVHLRPEVRLGRLDVTPQAAVQPVRGGQVDVEVDPAR